MLNKCQYKCPGVLGRIPLALSWVLGYLGMSVRVLGLEKGPSLGPMGLGWIPWGRGYKQLFLNSWLPLEPTKDTLAPTSNTYNQTWNIIDSLKLLPHTFSDTQPLHQNRAPLMKQTTVRPKLRSPFIGSDWVLCYSYCKVPNLGPLGLSYTLRPNLDHMGLIKPLIANLGPLGSTLGHQ